MTATYNSTTNVITITSTNFASFVGYDTVTLTAKVNCEGTEYSTTITSGDVTGNDYTITNSTFFNSTSTLSDGVYAFTLSIDKTDNTIVGEKACLFIDNVTGCNVAKQVANNADLELQLDYYILSQATDCGCDCQELCNLYLRVKNRLGQCSNC